MSHPRDPKAKIPSAEPKPSEIRINKRKEYPFDLNSERQKKLCEKLKNAENKRQPEDYIAEDTLNRRQFNIRRYEKNQEMLKSDKDKKKTNKPTIYQEDVSDDGLWSDDDNSINNNQYDSDLEEKIRQQLERLEIREEIRKKELEIIKDKEKKIDLLSILNNQEKRRLKKSKNIITNKIITTQLPPNLIKKNDDTSEIEEFKKVSSISDSIEKIVLKNDNINLEKEKVLKEEKITLLEEYDKQPFPESDLECIIFKYPQNVHKFNSALQNKRNMYKKI
jgi:hypothetical protein